MLLIAPSKKTKITLICILAIFGFSFQAFSQCPTIINPNPVICDASGLTISDLDAFANDLGNGISWWDSATGGFQYVDTQLISQDTYYADDDIGSCALRSPVTIDLIVDPRNQNLDGIFCDIELATVQTYIDEVLIPIVPIGGTVLVYTDFVLTTLANPATVLVGATNYYIVFVDNGGCTSQIEFGSTAVFPSAVAPTPPPIQTFCTTNTPTIGDLNAGTTSGVCWYDNIDFNGNPIPPALLLSTPLVDGNTYYVQVNDLFCPSLAVAVLVQIDLPVDAGTSAVLNYCEDAIPATDFNLFDELTGMPSTTGTWTGPLPTSNGHLGTVNISTLAIGTHVFTYLITSTSACPDSSSTVTIVIHEELSPGLPVIPISFCVSDLPTAFDLFTLLTNEDPNGIWTDGGGNVVINPIDLTGFPPGTYDFTYTQNGGANPCTDLSATVQIIILEDPNPGVAINAQFCENDLAVNSPFDLFSALDGSQDNNLGVWTDSNGIVVVNPIDITGFTIAGGPYTFTYTINNGACEASVVVTITVLPSPDSGVALAPVSFCEDDVAAISPFDLFDLLDGSQDLNGTWYVGTDTTGPVAINPVDLTILGTGVFNYTYSVPNIGSCSDAPVTVQITINPNPNPGVAINATFCENDLVANSPFDLFDALDGSQDNNLGVWTDGNGIVVSNPIDITGFTIAGSPYTFIYTINDGVCDASETVTITIVPAPDTGVALTPIEFCEDDVPANSPFDLFGLLDGSQDPNGTWYVGTDTTGPVAINPVDLTVLGLGVFNYTYSLPDIGTCSDAPVTVQITINPMPNSGTATPFIVCVDDLAANSPLDLFGQLVGNEPGGTWSDDDATGALTGNNVDLTLLTVGVYNFTYSITNPEGCTSTSTVVITIQDVANAGIATNASYCLIDVPANPSIDLFTLVTGNDTGGTWTDDNATGALAGSIVDITILGVGSYNFTYTVTGVGTCADDSVTVTITINDTSAPTAPANQDFCDSAVVNDLTATGINIQWYADLTSTTPLDGATPLIDGENYFATQTTIVTGCESSSRVEVIVHIFDSPNSGTATGPLAVCSNNTTVNLNDGLDGSQNTTGIWQDTDGTGALTANIFDASQVTAGTYTFTYFVMGTPPCGDASTVITVTVENPLSAGNDATLDICSDNGPVDLFTLIGNADLGGTWSPALSSGTSIFDPLLDNDGTYTYSISNSCGSESSDVVISVTAAPNAGTNVAISICEIDDPIDLFTLLGGNPDTNGTWSPPLISGTGVFDPALDNSGVYTYTVNPSGPCIGSGSAQASVTVNDTPPPVIVMAAIAFCATSEPTVADLNTTVTGNSINWYEELDSTTPLASTTALIDGEDYYASQTDTANCESSERVEVTVTINDSPTPTLDTDGSIFCINDNPTLATISENIIEFGNEEFVILWYASEDGDDQLSDDTALIDGETYYAALLNTATSCESSTRLPVTVDLSGCPAIEIPDGFSPNEDGRNDTFGIDNLDFLYPRFEMEIYNRYGNLVYKGNTNTPRFDGTSNQSGLVSQGNLPVGVYFYILNLNDDITSPFSGRLYLSR